MVLFSQKFKLIQSQFHQNAILLGKFYRQPLSPPCSLSAREWRLSGEKAAVQTSLCSNKGAPATRLLLQMWTVARLMLFEQSAVKVIVTDCTAKVLFFKNTTKSGILLLLGDYLPVVKKTFKVRNEPTPCPSNQRIDFYIPDLCYPQSDIAWLSSTMDNIMKC